jgi:hypothetical protein
MRADFLLRPGATWLFRIGTDGIAYEVRSLSVRAGQEYIVVKASDVLPIRAPATPLLLRCSGIRGARIDLPKSLDSNTCSYLESLGLNVWQTIRVWPVGFSAPTWDGEGWAEWLIGDDVCVGITSDKPIRSVELFLDGTSTLRLDKVDSSQPIFVGLPELSLGVHRLKVSVQNSGPNPAEQTGVLEFLIRSPKARLDAYKTLFRVSVDPERASLDDLWRGGVNLEIYGPQNRTFIPSIELCSGTESAPLARKVLPPLNMPATGAEWKSAFREHCDGDPDLDNHFNEAKYCNLRFDAGELGTTTLLFEHARQPLRWLIKGGNQALQLRLVNEGLDSDAAQVDYYPYEYPDQRKSMPANDYYTPTLIAPQSGLFVARSEGNLAGIITPPAIARKGLAGLGVNPQLAPRRSTTSDLISLLRFYELWATSRIVHHPLSFSFRRRVLAQLESQICELLYGETKLVGTAPSWEARSGQNAQSGLQKIIRSIPESAVRSIIVRHGLELLKVPTWRRPDGFAREVLSLIPQAVLITPSDAMNSLSWIAEFALRLASAPETLRPWANERLPEGLQLLLKHPSIVKSARFVVLAGEVNSPPMRLSAGPVHELWEWS